MKYKLAGLALFIVALAVAGAAWIWNYAHSPLAFASFPKDFSISQGSSLQTAARQMTSAEVLPEPWNFIVLGRLLDKAGAIKAGEYRIEQALTPLELLDKITRGEVSASSITLLEGWTFRQLRVALNRKEQLKHDSEKLSDAEILAHIGAGEADAEGLFFPDTYSFDKGSSDLDLLKRAYIQMNAHLMRLWEERDDDLPFQNPYEALIMASIVEKETGQSPERGMIAAVFVNRLKLNMKLQADPTVIYGLGEKFDGNLKKTDLFADNPYNTYSRIGLPPTPIAMPGLGSLKAVLNPPDSDVLYFVARGDGTSHFSESLVEHNKAVAKYQKSLRRNTQ
ncbi:MAG: endolytic transglycosylase MltG [Burkholderiales bacterium]